MKVTQRLSGKNQDKFMLTKELACCRLIRGHKNKVIMIEL